MSKPFDRKLKAYLNTMGVSLAMLDLLHLAPPSAIHTLSYDEMKSTNLVTAFGDAAELVSNSLCKTATPADNCKLEKNFITALAQPPVSSGALPSGESKYNSAMTISIVRSSLAGCEPFCPEWIFANGKITADSPALLKAILAKSGTRRLPIVIRSEGGDVLAAMAMGRVIRTRKLDVIVASTLFTGCSVTQTQCRSFTDRQGRFRGTLISNKDYCNAACVLVLASGQKRQVELFSTIGLQKLALVKPSDNKVSKASTAQKPGTDLQSDLASYFDEMGIDRDVLAKMDKVPSGSFQKLGFSELKASKLVTEPHFDAREVSGAACQVLPPPDNCIWR